jgi:hypothetical protein
MTIWACRRLRLTSAFLTVAILTTNLSPATPGVTYQATLMAQGGIPFYDWEIVSGNLPAGLHLDSFSGRISGTPAVLGTYSFSVRLRDYSENAIGVTNTLQLSVQSSTLQFDTIVLTSSGAFSARLLGPSRVDVIQVSSDLVTWSNWLTNSSGVSSFEFNDPLTNQPPHRFYRAVLFP